MLIYTHGLIANTIYEIVTDNLKIKLHKTAFKYGCIKPDLPFILNDIPHTKNEGHKFISKLIRQIQDEKLPTSNKDLKSFSTKLGVILHYVTDFFVFLIMIAVLSTKFHTCIMNIN